MSRRLMSLICLGMYCLCLWLAVQTVEKVRQISPGVSLRYAQALTGEQVKKAQTYIKSSQNTDGLMVTFWEETQVAVRSPVSTRTCTDVCLVPNCTGCAIKRRSSTSGCVYLRESGVRCGCLFELGFFR